MSELEQVFRQRRISAVSVYLRLVAQLLGMCTPIAMMLIVDKVVAQGAQNTLIALLAGVMLLTVFQYLFLLGHMLLACREIELIALPARRSVLGCLLDSSAAQRWSSVGWDVIQGTSDSARFQVETRPQVVADVLFVLLLATLMAAFSPQLLAVAVAFVPLYVLVEAWSSRRAERHAASSAVLRSQLSTCYFEHVAAGELVRGMNLRARVDRLWHALDVRLAAARYRLTLCRRSSQLGMEFLQKLSLIVTMLLGVSSVIAGVLTLGQYIAFNLLSMQLTQPVLRIAAYRRTRADHRLVSASREQVGKRCAETAWPAAAGRHRVAPAEPLVLEVDDVVLGGGGRVGFVLRPGLWLGITGPSGCGKSTLLRILAGLHAPAEGTVQVNGLPLHQFEHAELGRLIRLVPQDAVVFSTTIAENIRLGAPDAGVREIVVAATLCGLGPLLARLTDHLNTVVGPAGRALSGGERQRIAIARAVIGRPAVLLLDEATANLDAASEAALLATLRRHLPDSAVVVVSHRPASLARCRQVLRLDAPAAAETVGSVASGVPRAV